MPVVGYLGIGSLEPNAPSMAGLRKGLNEQGFVEAQNVIIETRLAAEGHYDQLLALAFDLVRRPVAVLVATGSAGSAQAAKAATTAIPIVFANGSDPVRVGLVASMNRPAATLPHIDFVPGRAQRLAGAGGGKDEKFEGAGGDAVLLSQRGQEGTGKTGKAMPSRSRRLAWHEGPCHTATDRKECSDTVTSDRLWGPPDGDLGREPATGWSLSSRFGCFTDSGAGRRPRRRSSA